MQKENDNVNINEEISGISAVTDRTLKGHLQYDHDTGNAVTVENANNFEIIFKATKVGPYSFGLYRKFGFHVESVKVLQYGANDFAILVGFRR